MTSYVISAPFSGKPELALLQPYQQKQLVLSMGVFLGEVVFLVLKKQKQGLQSFSKKDILFSYSNVCVCITILYHWLSLKTKYTPDAGHYTGHRR